MTFRNGAHILTFDNPLDLYKRLMLFPEFASLLEPQRSAAALAAVRIDTEFTLEEHIELGRREIESFGKAATLLQPEPNTNHAP